MEKVDTVEIFSTPVWISKIDNFKSMKRGIVRFLEGVRRKDPKGVHKSNYGGYQSGDIGWSDELRPVFSHILEKMVRKAVDECRLNVTSAKLPYAWVNFNDTLNAFNSPHLHHGTFSGIFYVNTPPGSGELVIENSGHNNLWDGDTLRNKEMSTKYNAPNCIIRPEEGSVIIWCSYLNHFVKPNFKEVNRISVSFNIHCEYNPPRGQ